MNKQITLEGSERKEKKVEIVLGWKSILKILSHFFHLKGPWERSGKEQVASHKMNNENIVSIKDLQNGGKP